MRVRAVLTAGIVALGCGAFGGQLVPAQAAPAQSSPGSSAPAYGPVIVFGSDQAAAAHAVGDAGAQVSGALPFSPAVTARLTASQAADVAGQGFAVVADRTLRATSADFSAAALDPQVTASDPGSVLSARAGAGVGVALIDTGVDPSPDLGARLIQGPDLSGEGNHLDSYGHGTFMAGLIAGDGSLSASGPVRHVGLAPGASVISIKVAGADGTTTLSKVLVGIGWAMAYKADLNIRVMNLSFGVDAAPPGVWDPLDAAVDSAWRAGIAVVAAAGNGGQGVVSAPGNDASAITVGAFDPHGTAAAADDSLALWSGQAVLPGGTVKPDLVAVGMHTVSLRAAGSTVDLAHPSARVGDSYFVGSGTSMATALVSGAVADLAADHPNGSPDAFKAALSGTARPLSGSYGGELDLAAADGAPMAPVDSRSHPVTGPVFSLGQFTSLGWWSDARWSDARWSDARWSDARWSDARWSDARWSDARWSDARWSDARWSDARWSDVAWGDG